MKKHKSAATITPSTGDGNTTLAAAAEVCPIDRKRAVELALEQARRIQRRPQIESALQQALDKEEFRLHYQPQVCLNSGEVTGMEALLRWEHPILGTVSPDQFIPIAEACGLIVPLGEWALRRACIEAKQMQRHSGRPLRLAVNLSARQFQLEDIAALIRIAIRQSGLAAESLEIEITESLLMDDSEESVARLQEIRSLGATIAIDDFGVGFSSLSYIARFPVDTLKIDRCFIGKLPHSATDAAVVQALIALGTSLGIRVVAEGVETPQQLDFLRLRNCDTGQGFHFGHAVPASKFSSETFRFNRVAGVKTFGQDLDKLRPLGSPPALQTTH